MVYFVPAAYAPEEDDMESNNRGPVFTPHGMLTTAVLPVILPTVVSEVRR